ncbi:hypothetical protein K402DRAFT_120647 [Aulographum hederae CBS 113979]|uniref:Uncharacterized protein n=1 Tax=Aulographum hederae CBS 113979 TaxID=1176131 RepID=A0A6G1GVA4_9PEZI|nr:hypothetical protein K402DRAFT_120647 [Aulographum hederae CBS 113979]
MSVASSCKLGAGIVKALGLWSWQWETTGGLRVSRAVVVLQAGESKRLLSSALHSSLDKLLTDRQRWLDRDPGRPMWAVCGAVASHLQCIACRAASWIRRLGRILPRRGRTSCPIRGHRSLYAPPAPINLSCGRSASSFVVRTSPPSYSWDPSSDRFPLRTQHSMPFT